MSWSTSVPWQLESSERVADRSAENAPGAVRRGDPPAEVQDAVVRSQYFGAAEGEPLDRASRPRRPPPA